MTIGWSWRVASVAALLAATSAATLAQVRWGSEAVPRAGVCFYEDVNMRGQYFCARPGENLGSLPPGMADRISSVHIIGGVNVTVFGEERFRGQSARFVDDVRDLRRQGWNDKISSIRVTNASGRWDGGRPPVWGNEPLLREGACFFEDANFRGRRFCLPRGASYAQMPPGFNDHISSIRVMRAGVMIFGDNDFNGRSTRITSDVVNLGERWNDRVSSIRVF
jgi:hypothetical protein